MPQQLSVLILTYNEEENIAACIDSIGNLADELFVLDSFSTDKTVEIANSKGAQVSRRPFDNYSAQRRAALELLQYEWVLMLDADERLTPSLQEEIRTVLHENPGHDAFSIRRETFFKGGRVRCWSGGSVVRLFRKCKGNYATDKLVHEKLLVSGSVGRLRSPILHLTFRSFSQYLPKLQSYSLLSAREAFQKGHRASWISFLVYPPARFLKSYLLAGGILDGIPGVLIAGLSAYSSYLKYALLWEMQTEQKSG